MNKVGAILMLMLLSCEPVPPLGDIPVVPFPDIFINTNRPDFAPLRIDGGVKELDGGVRGIILYRENEFTFHAFERNCSYLPNEACATVDVDGSKLFMIDFCCGSSFTFPNGIPNGGPAFYPLRKYQVIVDGTNITITDTIIY